MNTRDTLKPNHREFHCANGKVYGAHKRSCLFCKHCMQILYDSAEGPYMFFCECEGADGEMQVRAFAGECEMFEGEEKTE